jgi:hypothetical protein
VKDSRDLNALRNFRAQFPTSNHAKAAYEEMESLSWSAIRDSQQQSAIQQFLKDYPGGIHSAEAQKRIADLEPRVQAPKTETQVENPQRERDSVNQTLDTYRAAYSSRNLDEFGAIWVSLPRRDQWQNTFKLSKRIQVTLASCSVPIITGDKATVSCRQRVEIVLNDGSISHDDKTIPFSLQKVDGKWLISSVSSAR